ncbi:Nitroreductase family protein [Arboricoccus pini]|uniref:Nitroreductase family protein n=1 Tax=Arboricoccus pini TaxID=1963835 RepID=A0A212RUY1_9PROT|nr:Nitroreductase family protein [Arboricoccus pini]
MSSVTAAVNGRHSVRAFLDQPVEGERLRSIVRQAARAPSGGNLQPWSVEFVAGERLAMLKALMRERRVAEPAGEPLAHDFYPASLPATYQERRLRNGALLYGALGIARDDRAARAAWIDENFQFFGAPQGLFFLMPAAFGRYQWLDLGIFL